jgi:hypothetical protein
MESLAILIVFQAPLGLLALSHGPTLDSMAVHQTTFTTGLDSFTFFYKISDFSAAFGKKQIQFLVGARGTRETT